MLGTGNADCAPVWHAACVCHADTPRRSPGAGGRTGGATAFSRQDHIGSAGALRHRAQVEQLRRHAQRLRNRLDQSYIDKLDGVISAERYGELATAWNTELKEEVEEAIARHEAERGSTLRDAVKVFELT